MNILHPSGDIAVQQRDILLISTGLMLLIIVPVMVLTVVFAWRYRHSNRKAVYKPDWDHSTQLELIIWSAPLLIIICLGAMTWLSTHLLDPYRKLGRVAEGRAIDEKNQPLEIDAVALDWKWLFIYPEYGIAAVNDLAAPVDRPIDFHITSSSVMNSLFIPDLAGQIYAMPGMESRLEAVINKQGDYRGFSANYSGAGFSGMHFTFHALTPAGFDQWTVAAKTRGGKLDRGIYRELEKPSENNPVQTFGTVERGLFNAILNLCVEPGKMCMSKMSAIDATGGLGLKAAYNLMPLEYDKYMRRGGTTPTLPPVADLCVTLPAATALAPRLTSFVSADTSALIGAGLSRLDNRSKAQ